MTQEDSYKESFRNLVESVPEYTYLGEGNPNSDILIIGKECAISDSEFERKIVTKEVSDIYRLSGIEDEQKYKRKEKAIAEFNLSRWRELVKNNIPEKEIIKRLEDKVGWSEENNRKYYPFFPHLGQRYQQRKTRKDGRIISEHGTSATWYFYQSLVDEIMNNPRKDPECLIDFHLNSFHTEMSQIPLPMSNHLKANLKHLRKESIKERSKLFQHPFFRQFPVIILAAGHYPRENDFNIEEVFDVNYQCNINLANSWGNIHHQRSGSPRILIHTRQFSMLSSNFIVEMTEVVKEFLQKNGIAF